jgi:hypothetical protein
MRKFYLAIILLVASFNLYSQSITISLETNSVVGSTILTPGATNQNIYGIKLAKSGGGTGSVTDMTINFSSDPSTKFSNPQLWNSSDNTLDGGDLAFAGSFVGNTAVFTGAPLTSFGGSSGGANRWFFLTVDVTAGATGTETLSFSNADVVATITVNANSISHPGSPYTFLTTSIASLNAGGNNVAVSPLIANASGKAVFGFSLTSGGSQTVTVINVQLSSDPSGKLGTYSLVRSTDSDFATAGDNTTIGGLTFTPTATQVGITGLSEAITSTTKNYFLVANVNAGVTGATASVTASLGSSNITVGSGSTSGSASGTAYSFTPITATITSLNAGANNIAPSPLVSSATGKGIFGFSLSSNSSQTVSVINVQLTSDPANKLGTFSLVRSTDPDFSTTGDNTTIGGLTFTPTTSQIGITGLAEAISGTAKNYFLVANIDPAVTGATVAIQPSLGTSDVTVSTGVVSGSSTGTNYSFQSLATTVTGTGSAIPLVEGATNQSIFTFSAQSNGSQTLSQIDLIFSVDIATIFNTSNFVFKNGVTTVGTPSYNAGTNTLSITGINVSLSSSQSFTLRGDLLLNGASSQTLSLSTANVTVTGGGSVNAFTTITNTLNISALTTTVTASGNTIPLVAGAANQSIFTLSAISTGSQTLSQMDFIFSVDIATIFNTSSFVFKNGVTTVGTPSYNAGTKTLTVTGIGVGLSSSQNFSLLANVLSTAATSSQTISLSTADVTVTGGGTVNAFTTVTNTLNVTALTATLAQITAGTAPVTSSTILNAGATAQVLTGFSVSSTGTQQITAINFNLSGLGSQLTNINLYKSSSAGTVGSSIATNASGNFTGLTENVSTTVYYYLVADIAQSVTSNTGTTPSVTTAPTEANVTFSTGTKNTMSISRTFTFNSSQLSSITLNGGTSTNIAYGSFLDTGDNDINGSGESKNIATFRIIDPANDPDNLGTTLTDLTISISNSTNIDRIVLFDAGTNLEIAGTDVACTPTVIYNGLSLTANDNGGSNGTKDFTVRVSFKSKVNDNDNIQVTILSATASNLGSGFAAANAGGATTGGGVNDIVVTATKLIFVDGLNQPYTGPLSVTPSPNIGSSFSATVWAADGLNNRDQNQTSSITLNVTGGTGTLTGGGSQALVAGARTFGSLSVNTAGSYNVNASDGGGPLLDANSVNGNYIALSVTSLGVIITNGVTTSLPTLALCYGGAFQPYSNIKISESDPADFASGGYFMLQLPSGFIFDTSVTPTVGETGNEVTINALANYYVGNDIVRIKYSVSGTSDPTTDAITISGLKVRYPGTTAPSTSDILVIDAGAVQVKNAQSDARSNGTLTAYAISTVGKDFEVKEFTGQPAISSSETRFSINTNGVQLLPSTGTPTVAQTGVFSGNGVSYSVTQGSYIFSPSSVGVGSYVITYTVPDQTATNCSLIITKTFEVFSTAITNLNTQYCSNSVPSTGLSVSQGAINTAMSWTGDANGDWVFYDFVYYDANLGSYMPIPAPNTTFDPLASQYQRSILIYGGVYIYYRVQNINGSSPNYSQIYYGQGQYVPVYSAPSVSFYISGASTTSFCSNQSTQFDLVGSPSPNASVTDFFTSSVGVTNPSGTSWKFQPSSVPGGSQGTPFNVTYTYKDPLTGCSNTSSPTPIVVYPQPTVIDETTISVAAVATASGQIPTNFACQNYGFGYYFDATPTSGVIYNWYANSGLTNLQATGDSFYPGAVNVNTPGTTPYYVTQTINGCQGPSLLINATVNQRATVDAGTTTTICSNSIIDLTSTISPTVGGSATGGTWDYQYPGGGVFKDISNNVLSSTPSFSAAKTYAPSPSDIQNGWVFLELATNDPAGPCPIEYDYVYVYINQAPVANAGTDDVFCGGQTIKLNGSYSGVPFVNITWTTNGAGTFSDNTSLFTSYIPSPTETSNGATPTMTLTTADPDGSGPCLASSDQVLITINQPATINAGSNTTICSGNIVPVATTGLIGGSATTALWTSTGTGQFQDVSSTPDNNYSVSNKYVPDATDISNKLVTLTLTTNDPDGVGPCQAISDDIIVTINPNATATAGADVTYCSNEQMFLVGGSSSSSTLWTTNGSGTFSNDISTFSQYFPSSTEQSLGATITMTLTAADPDGGGPCNAVADNAVLKINKRATINAGADFEACSDQTVQLDGSLPANSATTSFTWSTSTGGTFSNNAILKPSYNEIPAEVSSFTPVVLTITSNDPDGIGPCLAESDNVSVLIKPDPAAPTLTVPDPVCVTPGINGATKPLTANGTTLIWYNNTSLTTPIGTGSSFATGVTTIADVIAKFFVTQTVSGCESTYTRDSIVVNPAPAPNFAVQNFCFGDDTQFTDNSTLTYNNGLSGSIQYWQWDFGNGFILTQSPPNIGTDAVTTHNGSTTGTYMNPAHQYGNLGIYNPILKVTTSDKCENSVTYNTLYPSTPLRVGPVPVANFFFKKICDQDLTTFDYDAGPANSETLTWAWDFSDASSGVNNTSTINKPNHKFTTYGSYAVNLIITTSLNCKDTVNKPVSILPYIKTFPYIESFESAGHGWFTEGFNSNSLTSWQLNVPNGETINSASDGTQAWFTRVDSIGTYFTNERSTLNGPCIDVTQLPRPALSFDYWNNTDTRNDGAYMEVSTNDGQNWDRLGNVGQGLNWYDQGFIRGLTTQNGVGQDVGQFGWSGNTAAGWTKGKFSLEGYKSQTKLRVRFVFGSNPDKDTLDGFAIDHFKLDSLNRVVLVENFTSETETANNTAYVAFKSALTNDEVVKIQYHTGLTGNDAIYNENKTDPNARIAYYGITNSDQLIPRGYLDGFSNGDFTKLAADNITLWTNNYFSLHSLEDAPFAISINTLPSANPGMISIAVSYKALDNIPGIATPVVHVVVVEKQVSTNEYVVRKMLPSAVGTTLTTPMLQNQTGTLPTLDWLVDNSSIDVTNLAVVVFIQDRETKRVYQSKIDLDPDNLPTLVTGVEPELGKQIKVYPNPADQSVTVEMPATVKQQTGIKMFDMAGHEVQSTVLEKGERKKTLHTLDLAAGVYMMQVEEKDTITQKKVIIVHKGE